MCKTDPGKCTRKNIVYRYDCLICQEEEGNPGTSYIGEEHRKAMAKLDPESPMVEHQEEKHQGQPIRVAMKLVAKVPRPLDRKVTEGVLIASSLQPLMNRKGEWGQHLPPQYGLLDGEEAHKALKRKKQADDHPGGPDGHQADEPEPPPQGPQQQAGQIDDTVSSSAKIRSCLLYTSPSPRDAHESRMPSSA